MHWQSLRSWIKVNSAAIFNNVGFANSVGGGFTALSTSAPWDCLLWWRLMALFSGAGSVQLQKPKVTSPPGWLWRGSHTSKDASGPLVLGLFLFPLFMPDSPGSLFAQPGSSKGNVLPAFLAPPPASLSQTFALVCFFLFTAAAKGIQKRRRVWAALHKTALRDVHSHMTSKLPPPKFLSNEMLHCQDIFKCIKTHLLNGLLLLLLVAAVRIDTSEKEMISRCKQTQKR